jgi:hypothetical protein
MSRGVNTLGKWVFIPWVGDRYTMGRGQHTMIWGRYTLGRGFDIPWVGVKIPWIGLSIYHGEGVKIPWVGRSQCRV